MKTKTPVLLLFLIILLEGYIVLSAELLAIRQTIPFVGSGTDTVSIIIAAVLLPLAAGYYAGGHVRRKVFGHYISIRKRLIFNILAAQIFLIAGLSYLPLSYLHFSLASAGMDRLAMTGYYAVFLAIPVFLLGQTIPLISHYLPPEKLPRITGAILFFSTAGSFLGAILPALALMGTIGVNKTAVLTFALMTTVIALLSRKKTSAPVIVSALLTLLALALNSNTMMGFYGIVKNNVYNTIIVYEDQRENRHLILNNNFSAMSNDAGEKYKYIEFMEQLSLPPYASDTPEDILVLGAGGFSFGLEDERNRYDYVDIDGDLKEIAEEHIINRRLTENKTFHDEPARSFLTGSGKKYDIIIIDLYAGYQTLPEHMVTREFFQQVKNRLKEGGVVLANFLVSSDFQTPFSRNLDNTFRSVFPNISRHVLNETYLPRKPLPQIPNVIYIYRHHPDDEPRNIYTDDKNTSFRDKY